MPFIDPVTIAILVALVVLLAIAAINDVRTFTIPNRLNLAILALYPVYVIVSPTPVDWQGGLTCGLLAFGVGAIMFAMRWVGGGDVKMVAVTAVWAGPELLTEMLIVVCVVGGIYSVLEGIRGGYPARYWRRFKNFMSNLIDRKLLSNATGGTEVASDQEKPVFVPYGVAIFVGGFFVAVNLMNFSV